MAGFRRSGVSRLTLLALAPSIAALSGCVSPRLEVGVSPAPTAPRESAAQETLRAGQGRAEVTPRAQSDEAATRMERIPPPERVVMPLRVGATRTVEATPEQIAELVDEAKVEAALPPQSVPQFVDTMFSQILQVPYILGPGVSEKREIVSLRGSVSTSKRALFAMTQTALRDYGLILTIDSGAVRVVRDDVLTNNAPLFVAGRALPETPQASRPVIQFFELKAIDVNSMIAVLADAYPSNGRVKFTPRQDINTLVITGNARDVASAAEVIANIDQPRFANANIARISPVYWAADKLVEAVNQTLATEGFQAARGSGGLQRAITFLPVPYTNQVLIFSNHKDAFDRALFWISEMDKPTAFGDQENVFIYTVENTSADELGKLVLAIQNGGGNTGATTSAAAGRPGEASATPAGGGAAVPTSSGRITVDPVGNRLLYRGTPSEFQRWRDLVEKLDIPPQQVLVEMTIAEVTLTDETRLGVEWFIRETVNNGTLRAGTNGGLGLTAGGFTLNFAKADIQAVINAFASNNNVNILSTPRLVARSGGEANIQIGTDVPIITSQRAANSEFGGQTDILQTVQYRQTGVILNMKPIVYGDERIDLTITQEVSSQQSNPNAAIGSPLILNRSVATQISLQEGSTAVIGGLIQDNYTRGTVGVPILKDLPFVGTAFRSDTVTGNKTELLILVTPYIVRADRELADAAANYAHSINRQMSRRGPHAYTLLPWSIGLRPTRIHQGQAPFERNSDETDRSEPPRASSTSPRAATIAPSSPAPPQPATPAAPAVRPPQPVEAPSQTPTISVAPNDLDAPRSEGAPATMDDAALRDGVATTVIRYARARAGAPHGELISRDARASQIGFAVVAPDPRRWLRADDRHFAAT